MSAAAEARAASPAQSVRLPVGHDVPLRPPRRGGARGKPLRLAVDRVDDERPGARGGSARVPRALSVQRRRASSSSRPRRRRTPTASRSSTATRSGGCSAGPRRSSSSRPRSCSGCRSGSHGGGALRPLTAADAPAVVETVAELAREQGLEPPRLFWNPLDAAPGGLAFGHPGRYSIALTGGLVVKHVADPPLVRGGRTPRARAHPEPRRRDHLLHARGLVRVPARRGRPLRLHPARRKPGDGLEPRLAARRARAHRLPDPQRRAPLARDLRGRPRLGPGRTGRRAPTRARRAAAADRPGHSDGSGASTPIPSDGSPLVDDTRPLFPLGAIVAFAAGLTATIAYDSVVQLLSTLRHRPVRPALPRRRRVRAARRRQS